MAVIEHYNFTNKHNMIMCVCVCVCNKSTFNLRFYACLSYDLIFLVENLWKCLYRGEILSFKVSALNRRCDDSHVQWRLPNERRRW